jgi:hypothetical protein
MKVELKKLTIKKEKIDINLSFYFLLKHLVKLKLTDNQAKKLYFSLLDAGDKNHALESFKTELSNSKTKLDEYENILFGIDNIELFVFSLQLYMIKDLLLSEADLGYIARKETLSQHDPLSLTYDRQSLLVPYTKRVNGALLSLIFFENIENGNTNFVSQETQEYLKGLSQKAMSLKLQGVEPNQIFMLMFSESINHSIISSAGKNYEDRIFDVLTKIGIPAATIKKVHDKADRSTEYDFFFELDGKSFGIGAKKTLRERYKQFIKTAMTSKIDVVIEITLGLDLNEEKAKTILEHGTKLFVSDEIYQQRLFLQKMKGIYSTKQLDLELLKHLAENS